MKTQTYENMVEAKKISDLLLGKEGMDKYPWMLLAGLFLITRSIKKHLKIQFGGEE